MAPLTGALFFSGAAGLIYQVLWVRQLTLVMGTTVEAVSTVLATFMAGLGLGSAIAGRFVDRLPKRSLPRLYAALEGGIAAFAAAFPLLLHWMTPFLAALYRSESASPAGFVTLRFLSCALLLLLPTTLMGATLPTLAASLGIRPERSSQMGEAAGVLYASNTVGAMMGSLITGVVLLNLLGMGTSNWLAVGLNLTAGGWVLAAASNLSARTDETPGVGRLEKPGSRRHGKDKTARERGASGEPPIGQAAVLGVIALSGLGALMDEVAWTRTLVLLIGPTTYGFSFVVTSVIAGIALGSAVASRWTARTTRPASLLALVEVGAGLASIGIIQIVGVLPVPIGEWVRANADRMVWLLGGELLWVLVLLLAPSFLFGAAFPLAVRAVFQSAGEAGRATGRVYGWNTFGAVVGSLAAGFLVLPWVGLETTLYLAAAVHVAASAVVFVSSSPSGRRAVLAAAVIGASAVAPVVLPRWDPELLSGGAYKYAAYLEKGEILDFLRRGDLLFYEEGRTATVSVKKIGSQVSLAIDGKVDATNAGDMLTQRLLAHVPLLLHPEPRQVCVIGYGSGVTAGSALIHPIAHLDAVEISAEVVKASAFFEKENHDAQREPRLTLHVGDGRNYLLLGDRIYDVIISEPSNPWMAGVSPLFSRDFFRLARARLARRGLFCQWAHIYNMAEGNLETIVASFTDAFPQTWLFIVNESDILLLGAADELPSLGAQVLARRLSEPGIRGDLATVELRTPYAFASLYAAATPALAEWASGATRQTDDRPVLEFRAPRFMHADTGASNRATLLELGRGAPVPEAFARLRSDPTGEDIQSRAFMLEKSESFAWALETYMEATRRSPQLLAAHEGIVRTAIAIEQTESAERVLRSLCEPPSAPGCTEAGIGLGLLFRNTGRLEDGLKALEGSLRADPTNIRALLLASEIQGELGRADLMEELARRAMEIRPTELEAHAMMAEASLRRGEPELALSRALAVVDRDPDQARALQVVAIARAQLGDRQAARSAFRKLTEIEPDGWIHFNNLGQLEMESKDFEAAARFYEKAVDINPRNVAGHVGLRDAARILQDRDRLERAESMLHVLGVND